VTISNEPSQHPSFGGAGEAFADALIVTSGNNLRLFGTALRLFNLSFFDLFYKTFHKTDFDIDKTILNKYTYNILTPVLNPKNFATSNPFSCNKIHLFGL
jgi:hypothetical protein